MQLRAKQDVVLALSHRNRQFQFSLCVFMRDTKGLCPQRVYFLSSELAPLVATILLDLPLLLPQIFHCFCTSTHPLVLLKPL